MGCAIASISDKFHALLAVHNIRYITVFMVTVTVTYGNATKNITPGNVQGDHWSGKPGNVSRQGNVRNCRRKILSGKLFVVNFTFGATPMFSGTVLAQYAFLRCTVLHSCTVITVTFRYYTVSMHDVGNSNMGKRATESGGMSGNFTLPGAWSP